MSDRSGFRSVLRTRNSNAFRHPEARSVDKVRGILEPKSDGVHRLSNADTVAIATLERIAQSIKWKPRVADRCDPAVCFALALQGAGDADDPSKRVKAMVCRAYAAAARYAEAFAQDVDDAARSKPVVVEVKKALNTLLGPHEGPSDVQFKVGVGPLQRAVWIADRYRRGAGEEGAHARRDALEDAFSAIDEIVQVTERAGDVLADGEGIEPRDFFVLRLAEVLAVSSRLDLYFHAGKSGDPDRKKKGVAWGDLVRASLDITGLSGDDRTVDAPLRRLRGDDLTRWFFSDWGLKAIEEAAGRPFIYADLPSARFEGWYNLPSARSCAD